MKRFEFELCADQLLGIIQTLEQYKDDPEWEGAYMGALNAYEVLVDAEGALYADEQN